LYFGPTPLIFNSSTKDVRDLITYRQQYVSVILQTFMHVLTQVNETTYELQPIGLIFISTYCLALCSLRKG